jgi:valine--pyruvate aminotransferase
VTFSLSGMKMASRSGLRSIMDDIAATTAASTDKWLNLSIGNPALIPAVEEMWREALRDELGDGFARSGCQYGPSRGADILLEAIAGYFRRKYRWQLGPENIAVGPGSQMLCFAAGAIFAGPSPGRHRPILIPTLPDYTGYEAMCLHRNGVVGVPPIIEQGSGRDFRYRCDLDRVAEHPDAGMLLMSSPSNPAGRCASAEEMVALAAIAANRDVPLVIDHAYGRPFPRIVDTPAPPLLHPNVINCFTISKAGLPGERLAFAIGEPGFIDAIVSFIANTALHASQMPQLALAGALKSGRLDEVCETAIRPHYAAKRHFAETLLEEFLPDHLDWRLHVTGGGGMFCWIWVDDSRFDGIELYRMMKERHVFIVPGEHFFVPENDIDAHAAQCFRLSLSGDEDSLAAGVERIGTALREMCRVR